MSHKAYGRMECDTDDGSGHSLTLYAGPLPFYIPLLWLTVLTVLGLMIFAQHLK